MDFLTNHISGTQSVVIVRPHQPPNTISVADRAVLGTAKEITSSRELRKAGAKPKNRIIKMVV